MRPVLLEMNGFASFREPATVDFTDADYFALVGPTGAGKSTVVDALTFALYGSVPRWNNKSMVSLALAPTTTRGLVRLVFDIGPTRYVVARELRRAASGSVNMRSCRLERLLDPAGTGLSDEDTEVLEADSRVTDAVERLLGLSFEDFCQCVVLPQGKFAEFLRATPGSRQTILLKLLGAEHYSAIGQQANARAQAAAQQARFLAEQLAHFPDATEDAQAAAQAREDAVAALAARVEKVLPQLAAASTQLADAREEHRRLTEEERKLRALAVPADAAELDDELTSAQQERARAQAEQEMAQAEDTKAREALAAAPPRGPLEQVRHDHAELARLTAEMPQADGRGTQADAALRAVAKQITAAEEHLEQTRAKLSQAGELAAGIETTVDQLDREESLLASVHAPAGVAELGQRLNTARDAAGKARGALEEAEAEEQAARAALSDGVDRGRLELVQRHLADLKNGEVELADLARQQEEADKRRIDAARIVRDGAEKVTAARTEHEELVRAHTAAALRRHLHPGDRCPVCEQTVATPPAAEDMPALDAAERSLTEAERELEAARRAEDAAAGRAAKATAALEQAEASVQRMRTGLAEQMTRARLPVAADGADVTAALAAFDQREAAAREKAQQLTAARALARRSQERLDEATTEMAEARTALRRLREPLFPLGVPDIEDADLAAAWSTVSEWAAAQRATRMTSLASARTELAGAKNGLAAATRAVENGSAILASLRERHTIAVRAAEAASADLARRKERSTHLTAALADALSDSAATQSLAHVQQLTETAARCDRQLRIARRRLDEAQSALRELDERARSAWAALSAARDPLVAFGAPDILADTHRLATTTATRKGTAWTDEIHGAEGLVAAWTGLVDWAHSQANVRDTALPAVLSGINAADAAYGAHMRALIQDLEGHDVTIPADGDVAVTAPAAVAATLERARADTRRVAERRKLATELVEKREDLDTQAQVARLLGDLLRSDKFPRWLAATALDALVVDASESLKDLSSGQFELTHDRGDFFVVDHTDADSRRSVRTLSGGETFQASLALALALSAQMSTLAAATAARLDSIFLDEGFGSLDPATLEVVAATLENLAHGERMVGVVTHVAALAERIPVRFRVQRDGVTSRIVREST